MIEISLQKDKFDKLMTEKVMPAMADLIEPEALTAAKAFVSDN